MSIKLLKTKICSESLKFLLLKVSFEGFYSKFTVMWILTNINTAFCCHCYYLLWYVAFQFSSLEKETAVKKKEKKSKLAFSR